MYFFILDKIIYKSGLNVFTKIRTGIIKCTKYIMVIFLHAYAATSKQRENVERVKHFL